MFPNLRAELARKNMSVKDLAASCGFIYPTLAKKVSGISDFTYSDIKKILDFFGMTFEYLFQKS